MCMMTKNVLDVQTFMCKIDWDQSWYGGVGVWSVGEGNYGSGSSGGSDGGCEGVGDEIGGGIVVWW